MKRGRDVHEAYAERLEAERLAQHNVGRCAFCPSFEVEGTLAETREALRQHRLRIHPEIKPRKRHTRRHVPMHTLAGGKTLDDNIAAARQQGAATWEGAT